MKKFKKMFVLSIVGLFICIMLVSCDILNKSNRKDINLENVSYKGLIYNVTKGEATCIGYEGEPEEIIIPTYIIHDDYKNVKIPVMSIDGFAFDGCESLISIMFEEGSQLTNIGERAFESCDNLTSIEIPNSVTNIGSNPFEGTSLTYNTYDNGKYLGNKENPYLVLIKTTSTYITTIKVHLNTRVIIDYALSNCQDLENVIFEEGSQLTNIGSYSFEGCSNLTNITIPEGVTSIRYRAFYKCSSLENIEMPNSLTSIDSDVFDYCTSLERIQIPNSVTSIGGSLFYNCDNLKSIVVDNDNKVYDSRENCNAIIETSTNELIVGCQNTIIPTSVTSIGEDAFSGCSNLNNITIPTSVKSIGEDAFYNCVSLTSIEIPLSVTYIGDMAFEGSGLESITIPTSVEKMGIRVFGYCDSLESITFEEESKLKYINNDTFLNCKSLESITIPTNVESILRNALEGCSNLTSVIIPSSVTYIDHSVFIGCRYLTNIYYVGTEEEWDKIDIRSGNTYLTSASIYYYSETQPTEEGNYWHYDTDGVTPIIW